MERQTTPEHDKSNCDICKKIKHNYVVFEYGDDLDIWICKDCLKKALEMLE